MEWTIIRGYRHAGKSIDRWKQSRIILSGSLVVLLAGIQCWHKPAYVALVSLLRVNLYIPSLDHARTGNYCTINSFEFM